MIKMLDVSLRDGGHRTNFHFNSESLKTVLRALDESGIEYIEIGYRNGPLETIANIGASGLCDKQYLNLCRKLIKKARIAIMLHPQNISFADLDELKAYGIDLVRICVARFCDELPVSLITKIKSIGLEVSVNFIHISQYSNEELDSVVTKAIKAVPNIIYFADSNGSLLPNRVSDIYKKYTKIYPQVNFGFHAHDNLGLAQTNTIAAIESGASYIDSSLSGMGKGIGNLKTEFFMAYLRARKVKRYSLSPALLAANYVRSYLNIHQEDIEMNEFLRGIFDLSTAEVKKQSSNIQFQDSVIVSLDEYEQQSLGSGDPLAYVRDSDCEVGRCD